MANVSATGDRNALACLKRVMDNAWFGRDTSGTAKAPDLLNTETLDCVNAAGTATVGVIGLNASNQTVLPNGASLGSSTLFVESASDALTAHSGGGQSSALALTSEVNRVTTAAAPADSVKLPASAAGLSITIINSAANPVQVFGAGTDTINDVATATGVSQMVNSTVIYECTVAGKWYTNGLGTGYSGALETFSFADALSANSGGIQTGATAITTAVARFTTVGGAGYSSVLPAAAPGLNITVINAGANAMNVFPAGTDAINALSASAAISLGVGAVCEFFSTVAGHWHTVLASSTTTGTGAQVLQAAPTLTNPVINGPAPTLVGSSLAITSAVAGSTILLNTAGGSTATLPAATGTGNVYKFVVSTTTTSAAHKILAASSSDFINGIVTGENASTAKCFASAAATNHSIQMPFAGTQPSGGFIGDWFEFTDIATNLWTVRGMYQAGTTPTTPFSSATS